MIPRLEARLGRGCEVGEALRECPITGLRNFVSPAMADQSCSLLLRTVFQERPVGLSRKAALGHWSVPSPPLPSRCDGRSSFAILPPGFIPHAFCGLETSCASRQVVLPFPMYPVLAWRRTR